MSETPRPPGGVGPDDPTQALAPGVQPLQASTRIPARVGRYTILRVLGEGGMGLVYEAEQENPRRKVALKVIRAGYMSPDLLRRFAQESQVLGRLQHPGIAQVYEAGTVEDEHGRPTPFFAMEFIQGVELTAYAASSKLGTRERLELVAKICDAVYHAHQKGVIHRDLKPGNILVDQNGQPRILDFGIARATDSDVQQTTMRTDVGQIIGTVPYMSPEQVSGDPGELDTRSDVYALGVIAYELLAGRLPFNLERKMIHEAARMIREEEPTRLSSINRTLRGDVETIVAKALEKDKTRRYQSAESLASDIRRFIRNEPISARPASTWYQIQKFSRRHTGLVAAVAGAFVMLAAGVIGTGLALNRALLAEKGLNSQLGETRAARAAEETQRIEAQAARAAADYEAYVARIMLVERSLAADDLATAREALDACPASLRGWEWRCFDAEIEHQLHVFPRFGKWLATMPRTGWLLAGRGNDCVLVDAETGSERMVFRGHTERVLDASFTPDGSRLISGGADKTARVWDCATGKELSALKDHTRGVKAVRLCADASRAMTVCEDEAAAVWDVSTGRPLSRLKGAANALITADFSADGSRALITTFVGTAHLWDATTGAPVGQVLRAMGGGFSPDGTLVVLGTNDGAMTRDAAGFAPVAEMKGHRGPVMRLAISPDGRRVATASQDKTIGLWDIRTGERIAMSPEHPQGVLCVAFDGNSSRIASASSTGVFAWDPGAKSFAKVGTHLSQLGSISGVFMPGVTLAFGPGDRTLAAIDRGNTLRLWDARGPAPLKTASLGPSALPSARFSPDGSMLAASGPDGTACVFDLLSSSTIAKVGGQAGTPVPYFVPGGLLTVSFDKAARRWELPSGASKGLFQAERRTLAGATISPDGQRVLAWYDDGRTLLCDVTEGARVIATLEGGGPARFDGTGHTVFTCGIDGTINSFDATGGDPGRHWKAGTGPLRSIETDRLGRRLLALGADGQAWLIDGLNERGSTSEPRASGTHVTSARLSPDAQRMLVTLDDGSLRIMGTVAGETIGELSGARILACEFNDDGTRIGAAMDNGTIVIQDASTGEVVHRHAVNLPGRATCLRFHTQGNRLAIGDTSGGISIVDSESGKTVSLVRAYETSVRTLGFNADGSLVVGAAAEAAARLWVVKTGLQNLLGPSGEKLYHADVLCNEFNADGSRALTACADGMLRIWDTSSQLTSDRIAGTKFRQIAVLERAPSMVTPAACSADGTRLIAANAANGSLVLWDTASGLPLSTGASPTTSAKFEAVVLSSDGAHAYLADWLGVLRGWDSITGKEFVKIQLDAKNLRSLALSPDQTRAATGTQLGECIIVDLPAGKELARLRGHDRELVAVAFHPDGKRLFTLGADKAMRVWDTATWRQLCVMRGPDVSGRTLVFSPDGTRLVTHAEDGTIRVWDTVKVEERLKP